MPRPKNLSIGPTQANADAALRTQAMMIQQNSYHRPARRTITLREVHQSAQELQGAVQYWEWPVQMLRTEPGSLTAEQLYYEMACLQGQLKAKKQALSRTMNVIRSSTVSRGGLMTSMNRQPQPTAPPAPLNPPVVPLDLIGFQMRYWMQWFPTHGYKYKAGMPTFNGRIVDLYQLHCEVMNAGSYPMVSQMKLWPAIGAKLGLPFSGAESQSSRSAGPAFAAYLRSIYLDFLAEFDTDYIRQCMNHRRLQQYQQENAAASGAMGEGSTRRLLDQMGIKDPRMLQELVTYSQVPASELQSQGLAPQIIALVERHRNQLQQTWEMQRSFWDREAESVAELLNGLLRHTLEEKQQGMTGANSGMPSSAMAQNGQHPQMGVSHPQWPMQPGLWISPQQSQAAFELVKRLRVEYKNVATPRPQTMVPDNQRIEYNAAFENLCRLIGEMDQKLPYYAMFLKEEMIKKLIAMIDVVNMQRKLLAGQGPPKYIVNLELVKSMLNQVMHASMIFKSWMTAVGVDMDSNVPGQPGIVPAPASESASSMLHLPSH